MERGCLRYQATQNAARLLHLLLQSWYFKFYVCLKMHFSQLFVIGALRCTNWDIWQFVLIINYSINKSIHKFVYKFSVLKCETAHCAWLATYTCLRWRRRVNQGRLQQQVMMRVKLFGYFSCVFPCFGIKICLSELKLWKRDGAMFVSAAVGVLQQVGVFTWELMRRIVVLEPTSFS